MIERIYLEDWAYNAGIVGFINILENSNKDFVITNKNYIEFDTKIIYDFHECYFKYFMQKYDIAKKTKMRIEENIKGISKCLNIIENNPDKEKEQKNRIKTLEKYIKDNIKTQIDKIKKFDKETCNELLAVYNDVDSKIDENKIVHLLKINEAVYSILAKKEINNKLTLNSFKKALSDRFFGQQSFINVSFSKKTYEEQKNIMYKDYVSNIVELDYINDILKNKYTIEEIESHIEDLNTSIYGKKVTEDFEKVYKKIHKIIIKTGSLEDVKEYIKSIVHDNCTICSSSSHFTSNYSEGMFLPLAVSSENMQNYFWNQNVKLPVCDICKIIYMCTPAGVCNTKKIIKNYDKGGYTYTEKNVMSFVNYDTSVSRLLKENRNFENRCKNQKDNESPLVGLMLDVIGQNKQISKWQIDNFFVVEFDAMYKESSTVKYFNIPKYVAKFFVEYAEKTIEKIKDKKLKLQVTDNILKDIDLKSCIFNRLRESVIKKEEFSYNLLIVSKVRIILKILKKGEMDVEKRIIDSGKKLNVLYDIGTQIHEELKKKGLDNKLEGLEYKMLNSLKSGNRQEFMDVVIRLHMILQKNVSPIFLESMKDESDIDFYSIGHSFIAGLISNKFEKKGEI